MRGWSVTIPSPGEVAARAQLKYWQALTSEQRAFELADEDDARTGWDYSDYDTARCLPRKSAAEIARIQRRQSRELGREAACGLKIRRGESSVDFIDRIRALLRDRSGSEARFKPVRRACATMRSIARFKGAKPRAMARRALRGGIT